MSSSPQKTHLLIYVIGCPGSGKGTLCKLLTEGHNCKHISLGDLLRRLADEAGSESLEIAGHVQSGTLVPTTTIINILNCTISSEMPSEQEDPRHAIIIDGFPRRLDQGMAAENHLGLPDLVLFFDCDKSVALSRYLARKIQGRLGDNAELFQRRHAEFERLNPAVLEYYRHLGLLIENPYLNMSQINTNGETKTSYNRLTTALKWEKKGGSSR
ncbi:MAG: hypothetical protein M1818_006202 [Claussenomyces sp. TS43310]|nr:MAG: hypothetical protein M1818_006202 [Claussenomyces sp. TS43310]